MHGILPLWKPKGMTSFDCVQKVQRLFRAKKAGHTGTLDPNVEGVLPVCLGEATKLVPFLTPLPKEYLAECHLGIATETEDRDGEIIEQKKVNSTISHDEAEKVLQSFIGEITQIPPMYSAVRVKGKRLYEYARENIEVKRPKRKVKIYSLKNLSEQNPIRDKIKFKVRCSAGTYIRTLCVDIGHQLDYPAHMSFLVRTESGSFTQEDTLTFSNIQELKKENRLKECILPLIRGVQHLDQMIVQEPWKQKVLNGQLLPWDKVKVSSSPFAIVSDQQLLAIYERHPTKKHLCKPKRVFRVLNER